MHRKDLITIAISVLALTASLFTLYWSQLRSAEIEATTGEWVNTGYDDIYKNFWLVLPVTFTNQGARSATVRKIALLIQTPDEKKSYLLEPVYFQKLKEGGGFVNESIPIPVAVPARESVDKLVKFASSYKTPSEFEILETTGSYPAWLLMWTTTSGKPDLRERLRFELSSEELKILKKDRAGESSVARLYESRYIRWRAQSLKDEEIKKLLE